MTPVAKAETEKTPLKRETVKPRSAFGPARATVSGKPLSANELRKIHAYWNACNYLTLGMIYLKDNPLLREPLNRLIKKHDLDMIFLAGPGHGAPGILGPVYLEGSYSEIYTDKSEDEQGMHAFLSNSRFRVASVVIAHPRLRARSTRGANLDTSFRTLVAPRLTIQI